LSLAVSRGARCPEGKVFAFQKLSMGRRALWLGKRAGQAPARFPSPLCGFPKSLFSAPLAGPEKGTRAIGRAGPVAALPPRRPSFPANGPNFPLWRGGF